MDSRPPDPPQDLHSRSLPLEILNVGQTIYRIHSTTKDPKFFGNSGDWRFDAPDASYGTLYAGLSAEVAFAETLLRGTGSLVAQSELKARSLCRFTVMRDLRLVRLYGPSMSSIDATAAITAGHYAPSQRWSQAIWLHPESPDGILYRATHDNDKLALVLFDRAQDRIDGGATAPLLSDLILLGRVLDHYRASIR
jgi:hypothetical protein